MAPRGTLLLAFGTIEVRSLGDLQARRGHEVYEDIRAFDEGEPVGDLLLQKNAEPISDGACAKDFRLLVRRAGVRALWPFRVSRAGVRELSRRKGVGVALYIAAAIVAKIHGRTVAADSCYADGTTSELAYHVWRSKRFRDACDVEGRIAVYRGR